MDREVWTRLLEIDFELSTKRTLLRFSTASRRSPLEPTPPFNSPFRRVERHRQCIEGYIFHDIGSFVRTLATSKLLIKCALTQKSPLVSPRRSGRFELGASFLLFRLLHLLFESDATFSLARALPRDPSDQGERVEDEADDDGYEQWGGFGQGSGREGRLRARRGEEEREKEVF